MSFEFTGVDIENGLPEFMPNQHILPQRVHASRSNSDALVFLVTVLLLFVILNMNQMSANFMLWILLGAFLVATIYASCYQLQAQAAAANGLLTHTELRLHVPAAIALATRGRLQGIRLHLALLDQEFNEWGYEVFRALDVDNVETSSSMSDQEINALPVHKYKVNGSQQGGSCIQHESSSASTERKDGKFRVAGSKKALEDCLTCSICLDQVNMGEVVRSLPCMHQFHATCIDPWLQLRGTCPMCKFRMGSSWPGNAQVRAPTSYMV